MSPPPLSYDDLALREIHAWKNPKLGWGGWAMQKINWPLDKAGDLAMQVPGVDWVIKKSIVGGVSLLNDAAMWMVRAEAIREDFRKAGYPIQSQQDISTLDLEHVDRVIGWLSMKYKGLAFAEGAATGAAGLPGIPMDVVALLTMALHAIGQYATYCGFDVSTQQERLFALNVLGLASSSTDGAKYVAMAQLVRLANDVAMKTAWKGLEQHMFVQVVQQIAKQLGVRLTKAKLAQVIPALGAGIGAGFNA